MESLQAVTLGVIQGITEFLPISSSGHLVIFQHLFGLKEPELFFDISLHLGTLGAVIIFFWAEIRSILGSIFHFIISALKKEVPFAYIYEDPDLKMALLVVVGSIPTGILGILFHKISDQIFSSIVLVGFMLLITGVLLWGTHRIKKDGVSIIHLSIKKAILIGLMQGAAILPGISRSGSTIAIGLYLGLNRETAAKYSFLLFLPAIIGAEILSLNNLSSLTITPNIGMTLLGTMISFAVGFVTLKWLLHLIKKGRFYFFAPYCWIVGITTLILG